MRQPTYYAVFYDVAKPKDVRFALHKRITPQNFKNLTDDIVGKEVELKDHLENVAVYKIIGISTFSIFNSVDNNFFVICDCEKLKK